VNEVGNNAGIGCNRIVPYAQDGAKTIAGKIHGILLFSHGPPCFCLPGSPVLDPKPVSAGGQGVYQVFI